MNKAKQKPGGPSLARRALNAFLAFVLAAGTMMTYYSYAELPEARADAAPSAGWYYMVAGGGSAEGGYVLNLDDCSAATGANAHITNKHASGELELKLLEQMWYVQPVEGEWFAIRTANGNALSAAEDSNDNLTMQSYNAGDADQQWRLDRGSLVSRSGDTARLGGNGLTDGSPIAMQDNQWSHEVTWSFQAVSVSSTLTATTTSPFPGTTLNVSSYDPGAWVGYWGDELPGRAAGASVAFSIVKGDGSSAALPYTVQDSDLGTTLTLRATVTSAFGAEIWHTDVAIAPKEDTRPGPGEGAGSIEAGDQWAQVDNTYFFNTGHYMNTFDHMQDPPFTESSFETHGGRMVKLNPSHDSKDPERSTNVYEECQIWPHLIGEDNTEGIDGWAFITDEKDEDAEGSWFSVMWTEAGTIHDAANTDRDDDGTLVDIKATYTITDAARYADHADKYDEYHMDGRLVIQIANNFSYGTFQFGVMDMQVTYEFYDHATGEPIRMDSLYYTKTSQDKGETLAVEPNQIVASEDDPGVFLSNNAYPVRGNPGIAPEYQYDVIPGTRLYNGAHHDYFDGMTAFAGVPEVQPINQFDYTDSVDAWNYYWRSTCMRLNMEGGNQITVHHGAVGWSQWTQGFDIPDPSGWDNGGTMYTTHNFLPTTNVLPNEPQKTINGGTDLVEGVRVGDTVHYEVSQDVIDLGQDGLTRYHDFQFVDELPQYVKYKEGSGKVLDPYGNPLQDDAGTIDYDQATNTVTYTFTEDYLANEMILEGGTYTFAIDVEVVDQPDDDLATVDNACDVIINGYVSSSNTVSYMPEHPELTIDKRADHTYQLASSIQDFEYLNHDENPDDFSTVHYIVKMQNTNDRTLAKNVVIEDPLAPGLETVRGSVKVSGIDGARVSYVDDGWRIDISSLPANQVVTVEFDAYTTSEGNGMEVVNRAETWCTNTEVGKPGSLDNHAWNESEIYINDPNLVVKKSVTESEVQNDDYQRGEEYRVDDTFTYTVTMINDAPGTFAKEVRLSDDDIPDEFELVGDIQVSGLDNNGTSFKLDYPVSGVSDDQHGEFTEQEISWKLTQIDNGDAWGWYLDTNLLDYGRMVTVTFTVKATQDANGWEVMNRAKATADNQPNDVFWSTDDTSDATRGNEYTTVWINTPEFQVNKEVRKTDQQYQIGDYAAYDVTLTGLKTPGTLARQTTLEDAFETEGTTIDDTSFVITDKPTEDKPQNILDQVDLNRYVGMEGWHIDMTQVYDDDKGYWVCSDDYRYEFKDGALSQVEGEHNPVQVKPEYDKEPCVSDEVTYGHDYMNVHYNAEINDMALQNEIIVNRATADSLEGFPVDDTAEVSAVGPALMIDKTCTTGDSFTVGDVAKYEVTIFNNHTATSAVDVQITDRFTTQEPGTVGIVEGSIELFDNQMNPIPIDEETQVEYVRNESGLIYGFNLDTNYDLPSQQKITMRYDVKYLSNNGGQTIVNTATTWADNAPQVKDDYEVWPGDMDQTDLRLDKGSDAQQYEQNSFGTYTLNVSNNGDKTLHNVTVHDEIDRACVGTARIVKGTITLYNNLGETCAWDEIKYLQDGAGVIYGFDIATDIDLEPGENLRVVYQMHFGEVAQPTTVHNDAWAASDDTGKATDDNDVLVDPNGTPDPGPGPDPDPTPNPGTPELSIVKDSNKSWYAPGEIGRYTLTVTNVVEDSTAVDVVISDALTAASAAFASVVPGTVKVVDAMGAPVSVLGTDYDYGDGGEPKGFTVRTGYDLSYGGNLTVTYDVQFADVVTQLTTVRNAAEADADNAPMVEDDHAVNLDVESHPEIALDKSVDKEFAAPGDSLAYTVKVSELTEGAVAEDVVVTDDLPEGFVLDQSSVKVEKDGHQQTVAVEFPEGKIRVSLGDVAYGEEWAISYSGTVDEGFLGDELRNVVIAESPSIPDKPQDEETVEVGQPRLAIEKTASAETVQPGDELTWNIKVEQVERDATAHNVVLTDDLPKYFEAAANDVTVTDHLGNVLRANVKLVNGQLTVELGDMEYGMPINIAIDGTVDEGVQGDTLHNVASADADNVPYPVEDDETVNVANEPALQVVKTADKESASLGSAVHYKITLKQTVEGAIAHDVALVDEIPRGLDIDMSTVKVTCDGDDVDALVGFSADVLTVQLGDVEHGEEWVLSYDAFVNETTKAEQLTNVVTASASNVPDEPQDEWTVAIGEDVYSEDLTLTKDVDRTVIAPGENAQYIVTAVVGNTALHNVVLTDELPEGMELDQTTVEVEVNGQKANPDWSYENNVLTVELGDLDARAEVVLTYGAHLVEGWGSADVNGGNASASSGEGQGGSGEMTADQAAGIFDLMAQIMGGAGSAGQGAATAGEGQMTGEQAAGLLGSIADLVQANGNQELVGAVADNAGSIAGLEGAQASADGEATVGESAAGASGDAAGGEAVQAGVELTNVVTATADGIDPVTAEATVTTGESFEGIDLAKDVDRTRITADEPANFTVTAKVGGTGLANVVLTDELPSGLSIDQQSLEVYVDGELTSVQVTLENNVLTVPMGDLPAGTEVVMRYACYLDANAAGDAGDLTNVVTATADGIDPTSAEATVSYDFGEAGNPMKGLDKTGDAILGFLSQNWPFMLAAVVLVVGGATAYFVASSKKKDGTNSTE